MMDASKRKATASGTDAGKRFKADASVAPSRFEQELAKLAPSDVSISTDSEIEQEIESFSQEERWPRPTVSKELEGNNLLFQQYDVDMYTDDRNEFFGSQTQSMTAVVRLFGINKSENSVCCHVHGFHAYFHVPAPPNFNPGDCDMFRRVLNDAVIRDMRSNKDNITQAVVSIESCIKQSIYTFHGNKKSQFLKVTVSLPKFVAPAKRILENGFECPPKYKIHAYQPYEADVNFEVRFMVDNKIPGCNWVELPKGKFKVRIGAKKKTNCQIEVDVNYTDIISHPPEGEMDSIGPLRILSFDIECSNRKGIFPEPEHDPVIQIANMVVRYGESTPFVRNVFTLGSCAPVAGSQVIACKNEVELLSKWNQFLLTVDPDIITGYNMTNFDFPYLVNRAKHLRVDGFALLGRVLGERSTVKDLNFQSKQLGKRENKFVEILGRVQFDLLPVIQRDYKLRSYTLNSVSFYFLSEQKEDVDHAIITTLQNGDEQTRRRLAVYCLKDAFLPLRLLDKLMSLVNYMEMARVTGVPLNYLLFRGQQIKVVSQLLRKCVEHDMLIPTVKSEPSDEFTGATVIEPDKGYYDLPITTLDFSSLYPSIMMAHNLCYSTLIKQHHIKEYNLSPEDYIKTPTGDMFVKRSVCKGLLPEILESLLAARKKAKTDLKNETDPFKKKVLDGRQLALKISANSVYGFTGAQVGKLPCLEISGSVTAFGRMMIDQTKKVVEETYTIANGYKHNAHVIYGDTDSVMIKFGVDSIAEAMDLGREAAEFVSKQFINPIKLEFEKVYRPYLLINKKRYAGLYFTRPEVHDKMDCKGIETVRRDNCPLVSNLLNVVLQKLLIERDPEGATNVAKQTISDLLCNRVDMSQLIITKELTQSDEEYKSKVPHVELAKKMKKRDPGSAPSLGDRIPYVITTGSRNEPVYMKAEDPMYVLENGLPIDTKYYLDQQLSKPLVRIFEPIFGESKAESVLLHGEHTRVKSVVTSKVSGLAGFVTKRDTCLSCKAVLPNDSMVVCKFCKPKESELYQREILKLNSIQEKFARLWTQCQRCQGSLHEKVLCTNRDCPIFYMRQKVRLDLTSQEKLINRFGSPADDW